jgi:hypothetical protein
MIASLTQACCHAGHSLTACVVFCQDGASDGASALSMGRSPGSAVAAMLDDKT